MQKLVREDTERVFTVPWLVGRDEGLFTREGYEIEIVPGQLHRIGAIEEPSPYPPAMLEHTVRWVRSWDLLPGSGMGHE